MKLTAHFVRGFWDGMAAPVRVFAKPTDYRPYMGGFDIASSFEGVGRHMKAAWGRDEQRAGRPIASDP